MDFADALREFADLLLVGSSALSELTGQAVTVPEVSEHLEEVRAIGARLREIGQAVAEIKIQQ